jgi:hypothetical protein
MKNLAILVGVLAILACGTGAGAYTITFDESYVTAGSAGDRQDGTQVTSTYTAAYGVTWADIYPGADAPPIYYAGQVICMPGEFSGSGFGTDNYLWIYGNSLSGSGAQTATVALSTPSDYFSIEYRRPQAAGTIEFDLYLGITLVYDGSALSWAVGDNWKTFTAPSTTFDKVVISESDKFCVDNFSINPVPIPGAIFLLAPGLIGLAAGRRRWTKR